MRAGQGGSRREPGSQAPRLPAFGDPGRRREGWAPCRVARQRRPGRGGPRRQSRRPGRGRLARRLGPARLPRPWRGVRPPGRAARLNPAMWPSFADVPAAAARANSGAAEEGAPASSDSDPARSDASASFPGSAEARRFGPDGPRAWGVADCRSSPNRALGAGPPLNRRAVVSDASPSSKIASGAASGWARRVSGPGFAAFGMGFGRALQIMSDKAILSDIATARQAGRIPRHTA